MSTKKPDAIRIAEWLEGIRGNAWPSYIPQDAAAELRRLHAENESLRTGYDAARLENASLQAQLEAIGAGGVEPLRKWECLHQISEPAQPVAWAIFAEDGGACMWTQIRQHAEATAKDIGLQVTPLYAAQAAPVDATVQRDAARYRFLRDGEWRRTDLESVIRLQLNTLWDSHIDAAIAAKKGEKP